MWQQRIYAFLLRRILGPYLTPQSRNRLHESINISLSEGRIELLDIDLDGEVLASKLSLNVQVNRAHVRKLSVTLSMVYDSDDADGNSDGLEKANDNTAGTGVSLIATVELDGLDLTIVPSPPSDHATSTLTSTPADHFPNAESLGDHSTNNLAAETPTTTSRAKGAIQSYVQAALDSLKLSLSIADLHITVSSAHECTAKQAQIALRVASTSYHDFPTYTESNVDDGSKLVMGKEICVDGICLSIGCESPSHRIEHDEVVRMDGPAQINLRTMSFPSLKDDTKDAKLMIRQFCEIILDQEIVCNLHTRQFGCLTQIFSDLTLARQSSYSGEDSKNGIIDDGSAVDSVERNACTDIEEDMDVENDDEEDMGLLSNILRQQVEAHRLASTHEVRGGLLLPDFSSLDVKKNKGLSQVERTTGDMTFDAFFDANDDGFSHYQSLLTSSQHCGADDDLNSSEVTLLLKEMSMTLHIDGLISEDGGNCPTNAIDTTGIYLLLRLGDCSMVSKHFHKMSDLSVGIGFLEIEDGEIPLLPDGIQQSTSQKDCVLHFVEEEVNENEVLVPSTECVSIMTTTKEKGNNQNSTEVVIKLAPLQLYYKKRTAVSMKKVIDLIALQRTNMSQMCTMNNEESPTVSVETSLNVDVKCDHVTVSLPLQNETGTTEFIRVQDNTNVNIERFFERSGYSVEYPDGLSGPVLSVVVSELAVSVKKPFPSVDDVLQNDFSIMCTCQKFLFSISAPLSYSIEYSTSASHSVYAYRFDFLSLESETQIDPNAIIKLEFTHTSLHRASEVLKRKRAKKLFPIVTQLSFVKASQQHESDDIDKTYQSYNKGGQNCESANLRPNKNAIRGSDPQAIMIKEASRCGRYVSVHVPSIVSDLSSREIDDLLKFMSQGSDEIGDEPPAPRNINDIDVNDSSSAPSTGIAFSCDQLSIALHEDEDSEEKDDKAYSQIFICDGIRTHCILESHEVLSTRFVCDDITLYEVNNIVSKKSRSKKYSCNLSVKSSINYRCNLIRRRRVEDSSNQVGSAVFFRSKLSYPLSPKTPALLIDMMFKRDGDDIERAVHFSIYDMTYRYDVDSQWINRLKLILKLDSPGKNDSTFESKASKRDMMTQSVTKLFITVSDCNFDYTSPAAFNTASSTIARVGEVRISSNIIIPAGPIQAFKISVADVTLFLSNKRSTHDVENSRLSCSNLIFDSSKDGAIGSTTILNNVMPQSFEDAVFKMNFISISTLDYLDAAIATTKFNEREGIRYQCGDEAPPDTTVTLSIGRVCLSTCKDSFTCLSETVGEMILKLSMPTSEELEVMQLENVTENICDLASECPSHTEAKVEQHNDSSMDKVSVSIGNDTSLSLAEVVGRDLFSSIVAMPDANSDILNVGGVEEKAQTNLASFFKGDIQTESQNEQNHYLDSNGEASFESRTVMIDDFYSVKEDRGLNDETTLADGNRINNTSQHTLVGNWTSVDYSWSWDSSVPVGEEQCGGWYSFDDEGTNKQKANKNLSSKPQLYLPDNATVIVEGKYNGNRVPRVFPRHVSINPVSDPLAGGDMGASQFAKTKSPPHVKLRVLVKEMSVCCRFFDGYDWTHSLAKRHDGQKANEVTTIRGHSKTQLMGELLGDNLEEGRMFEDPAERTNTILRVGTERETIKCRQPQRLFQFCYSGLKLRCDLFTVCTDHCLASCIDLSLRDMFISETISCGTPVKIIGEWANDHEHPRDSNDGLVMMKMVSVHPDKKISADGKLMGNESRVTMSLLPIRCYIHQSALRFIRSFFKGEENHVNKSDESNMNNDPPETFFQVFKVKPFKVKVDYTPCEIDTSALKDGHFIEILNLLPLEEMVLKLKTVELRNLTGWGSIMSELIGKWVQDVSSTQIHKFLTTTSPLHPIANVSDGVKQFVMIPLEEYRHHGHVRKAFQRGTVTLAEVVAYETLNISSKLTRLAARKLRGSSINREASNPEPFPIRPETIPRSIGDVSSHALASLSRGFKEANAKVVIMPYREYHKTGSKGSLKCVMKGIPVAICAPLSGVAEALSYGLLGARNQLRPEMRKEEEASRQFQHEY